MNKVESISAVHNRNIFKHCDINVSSSSDDLYMYSSNMSYTLLRHDGLKLQ